MDNETPDRPYWTATDRFPIGTRVRIRLSPECTFPNDDPQRLVRVDGLPVRPSHPPHVEGTTGTVLNPLLIPLASLHALPGHSVLVKLDTPHPYRIEGQTRTVNADCFAPNELEPIEGE